MSTYFDEHYKYFAPRLDPHMQPPLDFLNYPKYPLPNSGKYTIKINGPFAPLETPEQTQIRELNQQIEKLSAQVKQLQLEEQIRQLDAKLKKLAQKETDADKETIKKYLKDELDKYSK